MNYGQSLAYIILAANQLGGNFGYSKECNSLIKNKNIPPVLHLSIEKTALSAKEWVIKNNLSAQAQKIVNTL